MKQKKYKEAMKKEKARKKKRIFQTCVRLYVLTPTRSKIWAIPLAYAADRRIKKWHFYKFHFITAAH